MAALFTKGSYVWVANDEEGFIPAVVQKSDFKQGETGVVRLLGGRKGSVATQGDDDEAINLKSDDGVLELSGKQTKAGVMRMQQESLRPVEDMAHMIELSTASILYNLKQRYEANKIYTRVGPILVSVNPYKSLGLYSSETQDAYLRDPLDEFNSNDMPSKRRSLNDALKRDALPPHLYGVAAEVYRGAVLDGKDQSCIMSGESGAGKTESMKIFLQFLAAASSKADDGQKRAESIQERIVRANPLVEAFGNAKTIRNDNSSRFGQWISVEVDRVQGTIIGCSVTNYLLEKSRLIHQAEGERNYHVFYQLVAAAASTSSPAPAPTSSGDPSNHESPTVQLPEIMYPGQPEQYHFLNQSGVTTSSQFNDVEEYSNTLQALGTLGVTNAEQQEALVTLAGILHLGNATFKSDEHAETGEECAVLEDEAILQLAAKQLGLNFTELRKTLLSKNMSNSVEQIWKPHTAEQARGARDALAKALYGKLFDWVVSRVNEGMRDAQAPSSGTVSTIGVLDTFGFEVFEQNSFEQLCINFCNEKMQFYFNQRVFRLEQDLYASEGIQVGADVVKFINNEPCLTLLEKDLPSKVCVFTLIDDEIKIPRGSDENYLRKLRQVHGDHPNFRPYASERKMGTSARSVFAIRHYAGDVYYNVNGFLAKNRDLFPADLESLCVTSSRPFLSSLFEAEIEAASVRSSKPKDHATEAASYKKTLGTRFKEQLSNLMNIISKTETHFVRCIKPNDTLSPKAWMGGLVLKQLRYGGVLEACRIRRNGYPVRMPHNDFFRAYRALAPNATNAEELVKEILDSEEAAQAFDFELSAMEDEQDPSEDEEASEDEEERRERQEREATTSNDSNNNNNNNNTAETKVNLNEGSAKSSRDNNSDDAGATDADANADAVAAGIAYGKTLVFVSTEHFNKLESTRGALERRLACRIQSVLRGHKVRLQAKKWHNVLQKLEQAVTRLNEDEIESTLEECANVLPCNGGAHLPQLQKASEMLTTLKNEQMICNQLKFAMESRDLSSLSQALEAAKPFVGQDLKGEVSKETKEALKLEAHIKRGMELRAALRAAILANDIDALNHALKEAEEFFSKDSTLFGPEVDRAYALKTALIKEEQATTIQRTARAFIARCRYRMALQQLKTAMNNRDEAAIDAALNKLALMGINHPLAAEARAMRTQLGAAVKQCREELQEVMRCTRFKSMSRPTKVNDQDVTRLSIAIERGRAVGLHDDELYPAEELQENLNGMVQSRKKRGWFGACLPSACLPARHAMPTSKSTPAANSNEEVYRPTSNSNSNSNSNSRSSSVEQDLKIKSRDENSGKGEGEYPEFNAESLLENHDIHLDRNNGEVETDGNYIVEGNTYVAKPSKWSIMNERLQRIRNGAKGKTGSAGGRMR